MQSTDPVGQSFCVEATTESGSRVARTHVSCEGGLSMNAFEDIVARCFEDKGYWVRQNVKVPITKADKREIGVALHGR